MGDDVGVGQLLDGKYRLEQLLGEGGMGAVFVAQHEKLRERRAIKVLTAHDNPVLVKRFLREARAAANIDNEHVAKVYDVGELPGGAPFMVMELLEGRDLDRLLSERGPLPIAEAVGYALQACEALAQAHARGIIHRDIKPSNLFLAACPGGGACIKLLDFGISKIQQPQAGATAALTSDGVVLGSPQFMAPEQLASSHDVDARADVWSLGATLFELLTGESAFEGEDAIDVFTSIVRDKPRSARDFRSDIPSGLEAVLLKCLQKEPAGRYASVGLLAAALMPYAPSSAGGIVDRIGDVLEPVAPTERQPAVEQQVQPPLASSSTVIVEPNGPPAAGQTLVQAAQPASARPPEASAAAPAAAPSHPTHSSAGAPAAAPSHPTQGAAPWPQTPAHGHSAPSNPSYPSAGASVPTLAPAGACHGGSDGPSAPSLGSAVAPSRGRRPLLWLALAIVLGLLVSAAAGVWGWRQSQRSEHVRQTDGEDDRPVRKKRTAKKRSRSPGSRSPEVTPSSRIDKLDSKTRAALEGMLRDGEQALSRGDYEQAQEHASKLLGRLEAKGMKKERTWLGTLGATLRFRAAYRGLCREPMQSKDHLEAGRVCTKHALAMVRSISIGHKTADWGRVDDCEIHLEHAQALLRCERAFREADAAYTLTGGSPFGGCVSSSIAHAKSALATASDRGPRDCQDRVAKLRASIR